jgi:hypothetical protein
MNKSMKITESELLQAVWELQIKNVSSDVLHKYVNGGHSVVVNEWFWRSSSTAVHICSRQKLTNLIGKQQILKRLRTMIFEGSIEWKHKGCTFGIKNDYLNQSLFEDARNFWLELGVPTGFENGKWKTAIVDNILEKKQLAFEYLLKNHSHKLSSLKVGV